MRNNFRISIENACDGKLAQMSFLPGGSVGEVWKLTFEDGRNAVAKTANHGSNLDIEGYMLGYLATHSDLPIPKVYLSQPDLLVISWMENSGGRSALSDRQAAEALLDLHKVTSPQFGLERDTLIGPLHQPNPECENWVDFFRDYRLRFMAQTALEKGHFTPALMGKIEKLAAKLDIYISEPEKPSLIHGDVWGGNVLYRDGALAGLIDPAIYYGHREIELAYTTLFHTFGPDFFARYREDYPLDKDFFDIRIPIYHLYPLLVHCALFGGSYITETETILDRFV